MWIAVARHDDDARHRNLRRIALDRLDGLQAALLRGDDQRRRSDARQLVLQFHVDA